MGFNSGFKGLSVLKTHGVQLDSAAIKRSRNTHTHDKSCDEPLTSVRVITKHGSTIYAILVDTIMMETYLDWSSVIVMQEV